MILSENFKKGQSSLSRTRQTILKKILDNYEDFAFLSALDIAHRVGVSEATIIRLSQAMGFSGFPEFKKELQLLIRKEISTVSRLEHSADTISNEEDILVRVFQKDIDNISRSLNGLSMENFKQAVKDISKAKRVFIIGLRTMHALAIFLEAALRYINKETTVLKPGYGELWDYASTWQKGDVFVGICFPRYTKTTVDVIEYANKKGLTCIGITDSDLSPLSKYSDYLLTVRCDSDSYYESLSAPLTLLNALVTAVSVHDSQKNLLALKNMEEIWNQKNIYIYPGESVSKSDRHFLKEISAKKASRNTEKETHNE